MTILKSDINMVAQLANNPTETPGTFGVLAIPSHDAMPVDAAAAGFGTPVRAAGAEVLSLTDGSGDTELTGSPFAETAEPRGTRRKVDHQPDFVPVPPFSRGNSEAGSRHPSRAPSPAPAAAAAAHRRAEVLPPGDSSPFPGKLKQLEQQQELDREHMAVQMAMIQRLEAKVTQLSHDQVRSEAGLLPRVDEAKQ